MTSITSRWPRFVAELVRRTSQGELAWRFLTPNQIGTPGKAEEEFTAGFQATVENSPVRLIEFKARQYVEEDEFYTIDGIKLEILRQGSPIAYEVPTKEGLLDLKQAITKKLTGAEDLLDKLGL